MAPTDAAGGITIHLSLTSAPSAARAPLTLENGASAAQLRAKASALTSVPIEKMKLIFRGRVIPDKAEGNVAEEFKLEEGCVVHVMGKPVKSAESGAAAASAVSGAVPAGASVTLPGTAAAGTSAVAAAGSSTLAAALAKLQASNDGAAYRTALSTADKLLGNIISHCWDDVLTIPFAFYSILYQPMEEKYRTVKKANPAFSRRLGSLPGGAEFMAAAGFTIEVKEDVEFYVLKPSADAWPTLNKARAEVQRALAEGHRSGVGAVPVPPPAANASAAAGGFGASGMPGGMPGFPGGMPDASEMARLQNMMSDPNTMQQMMSAMNNPMMQQMLRQDPRFANNPRAQQALQALQSNPEMMRNAAQAMSDPNVRNRMASMMQQQQSGAGAGGAANPFGGGPDDMRRQMEQFQRMSAQFGGSGGGFNVGGAGGGGTTGTAPPASGASGAAGGSDTAGASNNTGSGGGSGGGEREMTEEEMIAEAIARSMRES
ncbi:hypothetical protein ACHAXT_002591 [Thalassiosira profunda]